MWNMIMVNDVGEVTKNSFTLNVVPSNFMRRECIPGACAQVSLGREPNFLPPGDDISEIKKIQKNLLDYIKPWKKHYKEIV